VTRRAKSRNLTCRAQLQDALGNRGEILPYVDVADTEFPARGWYASCRGDLQFLGDSFLIAAHGLMQLIEQEQSAGV
jgi:hypothetical protein